jgi:hypothetical protein
MKTFFRVRWPSDWVFVASLVLVMVSLILVAKINGSRAFSAVDLHRLRQEMILVTVDGAVAKPGQYSVLSGTRVGDVLKRARVKPLADLSAVVVDELIDSPRHIQVGELLEIKVFIRGEVKEPLEITLPSCSRICDLKTKVMLTEESDLQFFKRKKRLKNGEILEVPKKTVE